MMRIDPVNDKHEHVNVTIALTKVSPCSIFLLSTALIGTRGVCGVVGEIEKENLTSK